MILHFRSPFVLAFIHSFIHFFIIFLLHLEVRLWCGNIEYDKPGYFEASRFEDLLNDDDPCQ